VEPKRDILKKVEQISTIPTLPTVLEKITLLLQNPQTSAEEIGLAIKTDQSLASKVLKLVNSAFYGFPGRISTITHAVVILGFSTIKNIVLTASIFDAFKRSGDKGAPFDMEQFWLHSVACGAASKSIAKSIGFSESEECFIGGLLHDIGKIILCQHVAEEFAEIIEHAASHDQLFIESEQQLFTATHAEIGGMLTESWNLPPLLQHIVKFHHAPTRSKGHFTATAVVHTADILVRALDFGNGGDQKIPCIHAESWEKLGFRNAALEPVLDNIAEEIDRASIFMQI
jgi:putative nucleotidyltransferase with HDIG domain